MKHEDLEPLEPLDPELLALLPSARVLDAPMDAKARIQERLALSLPTNTPGGGGSASSPGGLHMPRWAFAAALSASGLVGFALAGLIHPSASPRERVVYIERPLPAPVFTNSSSIPAVSLAELPRVAATTGPAPAGSVPVQADLARERELLDVARAALGRGDAPSSLVATSEHERKFPRGALREEREAIAIQAMVLGGRGADATARADRFRRQFPQSLLLPAVEAAVGSAP